MPLFQNAYIFVSIICILACIMLLISGITTIILEEKEKVNQMRKEAERETRERFEKENLPQM